MFLLSIIHIEIIGLVEKGNAMNRHATLTPRAAADHRPDHGAAMDQIAEALSNLRFGAISVVVHDGRVTQIDVTEKRRLTI